MFDKELHKQVRSAIKSGDIAAVQGLLDSHQDRLQMMTPFGTWLHVAASFGQLDIVKWLVQKGMDINANAGTAGAAPVHSAASDGHLDVVKFLVSKGALLDVSGPERNPLFGAIYGGHLEIVKLLLESGIDASIRYTGSSMKNMDALAFAKERGQQQFEKFLASEKDSQND
jgi:ankyrin repeat protein